MGLLEVKTGEASISLPKPSSDGKVSVEKTIKGRRTVRDFREKSPAATFSPRLPPRR